MVHYFNFLRGEESLSPSLSLSQFLSKAFAYVPMKVVCLCLL